MRPSPAPARRSRRGDGHRRDPQRKRGEMPYPAPPAGNALESRGGGKDQLLRSSSVTSARRCLVAPAGLVAGRSSEPRSAAVAGQCVCVRPCMRARAGQGAGARPSVGTRLWLAQPSFGQAAVCPGAATCVFSGKSKVQAARDGERPQWLGLPPPEAAEADPDRRRAGPSRRDGSRAFRSLPLQSSSALDFLPTREHRVLIKGCESLQKACMRESKISGS